MFLPIKANCSDDISILEQGLSSFPLYSNANIFEKDGILIIKFPQTDTLKQITDEHGKIITISGTIPEYEAQVVKSGSFLEKDLYRITTKDTAAILSYLYNKYKITDIAIDSFSSEIDLVPLLHLAKNIDIDIGNIIFNSIDEKTKLKNEIGVIKTASLKSGVNVKKDKIFYESAINLTGIGFRVLFFDIFIPELVSNVSAVYKNEPGTDYSLIPVDMSSMLKSESIFELKDSEFSFFGISAKLNAGFINKSDISGDEKTIRMTGKFVATDIKFGQDAANMPQEIVVKYDLDNMDKSKVENLQKLQVKLQKLQNTKNESKEKKDVEAELKSSCASAAAQVMKDVKLSVKSRVKFEKATIEMIAKVNQSGDYMVGNGKILVKNFDVLYPDLTDECKKDKQNASNTIPDSCIKNMTSMAYRKYLDMEKRTKDNMGQTVDIFKVDIDSDGVYINGKKARDAIKFKFDNKSDTKVPNSQDL